MVEITRFQTMYDFNAEEEGELSVRIGEILYQLESDLLDECPQGWIFVRSDIRVNEEMRCGYVPRDFIRQIYQPAGSTPIAQQVPEGSANPATVADAVVPTSSDHSFSSLVTTTTKVNEGSSSKVFFEVPPPSTFTLSTSSETVEHLTKSTTSANDYGLKLKNERDVFNHLSSSTTSLPLRGGMMGAYTPSNTVVDISRFLPKSDVNNSTTKSNRHETSLTTVLDSSYSQPLLKAAASSTDVATAQIPAAIISIPNAPHPVASTPIPYSAYAPPFTSSFASVPSSASKTMIDTSDLLDMSRRAETFLEQLTSNHIDSVSELNSINRQLMAAVSSSDDLLRSISLAESAIDKEL